MALHLEWKPSESPALSTRQVTVLERLWCLAGLAPMPGYDGVFLAIAASSDSGLVHTLSSVDLDDAESVAYAVSALLQWRKRVMD
jgi:hypothetical protein